MTAPVVIEGLAKRYGTVEALKDLTLTLPAGSLVALVGHNGAGKTTLMKLMLGLIRPTAGHVAVLGREPAAGAHAERCRLGYLPENVSFNAALTGRETLGFYARLKRQPKSAVMPLLERVGLGAAADRRVGTYSKGMRQRLGLAQALLGEPALLLLDEPTTGLDPVLRQTFYDIVEALRAAGATVLLSSHALTELEGRADRIVILNRGVKVADGGLDELRAHAHLPVRVRLTVAAGAAERVAARFSGRWPARVLDGRTVELDASPAGKLDLIRHAATDGAEIEDIDLMPPTLDDIYLHFLRSAEARP